MFTLKTYTSKQVKEIVESEGLEYAIFSYISHTRIEDEELSILWEQAHDALGRIDRFLGSIEEEGE